MLIPVNIGYVPDSRGTLAFDLPKTNGDDRSQGARNLLFLIRDVFVSYIHLAVNKGNTDLSVQLLCCTRWFIETGATGLKMTNLSNSSRLNVLCV